MKRRNWIGLHLVASWVLMLAGTAAAQPLGPGGGAFWNQPISESWFTFSRWNGVLPFQGGVPDADVTAHISYPVQVDILGQGQQAACHHLSLGQAGVFLRIAGSSSPASLTVHGTQIDNFGQILVGGDDALQESAFVIANNTNANGTGTLSLRAPAGHDAVIRPTNNQGWLLVNWPDHTIEGNGTIGVRLQNDGVIHANRNGRTLTFNGAFDVDNNQQIRASNGGRILLSQPNGALAFRQSATGQLLIEPGSELVLQACGSNGLQGGRVLGGGQVTVACQGMPVEFVRFGSDMRVAFFGNAILEVRPGGIENNGLIQTGPTGQIRSQFGQSASLRGSGRVQLEGGSMANFLSGLGYALVNEPTHTIGGVGTISLALTNRGEVLADRNGQSSGDSVLSLQQSTMNNEGRMTARDTGTLLINDIAVLQTSTGQIRAFPGSAVLMQGGVARIQGGSILTSGSGVLAAQSSSATLQDVRIEAGSTVLAGCSYTLRLQGVIDQRGSIVVDNSGCGPNFATLQGQGTTQVIGNGEIRLRANAAGANVSLAASGGTLSLASTQMLTGSGNLSGAIAMHGVIMPDQPYAPLGPIGALTVPAGSSLSLSNSSQLVMDLGALSNFDRIQGSGNITVGGTLDVRLVGGYVPLLGDTFDLLTGSAIVGQFSTIRMPATLSALDARVDVFADRVRLTVVPPPFRDGFE